MRRLIYILMILALSVVGAAQAQDIAAVDTVTSAPGITIKTSVDRAEIYIGDLITYSLSIIHDSDVVLTPPPIGANLGAFDVKNYEDLPEKRLEDGSIRTESRFSLTTFTTGDYLIPPIPVEFMLPDSTRKVLISEPIPIKVKSLLAEGADTTDIKELKAPIEFKSKWPWWYYAAAGIILLCLIGFILWRIFRHKEEEKAPVDTRKPWEIASEKLAFLKEKNLPLAGEFKLYYVELTDIVREYLQRIYKIPVLDMTTYEFTSIMDDLDMAPEMESRIKSLLNFADLVKFAKYIPESDKAIADFDEACAIVEDVKRYELARVTTAPVQVSAEGTGGGHV